MSFRQIQLPLHSLDILYDKRTLVPLAEKLLRKLSGATLDCGGLEPLILILLSEGFSVDLRKSL